LFISTPASPRTTRRIESFQAFFTTIGEDITSKVVFICSDMWEPYLKVIREKCSEALHILDRFHIVAKMNNALDEIRGGESRRMASEGRARKLPDSDHWQELTEKERLPPPPTPHVQAILQSKQAPHV